MNSFSYPLNLATGKDPFKLVHIWIPRMFLNTVNLRVCRLTISCQAYNAAQYTEAVVEAIKHAGIIFLGASYSSKPVPKSAVGSLLYVVAGFGTFSFFCFSVIETNRDLLYPNHICRRGCSRKYR